MTDPEMEPRCGPVVLLCANERWRDSGGQAHPVNWSDAFRTVLEKRGFTDFVAWDYTDFVNYDGLPYQPGTVFVGPCIEGGLDSRDLDRLRALGCPIFVETTALNESGRQALGIVPLEEGAPRAVAAGAGASRAIAATLNVFAPLLGGDGTQGWVVPLPRNAVETRYQPPDPGHWRAEADDDAERRAAKATLKLAFALVRRAGAATDQLPFPAAASSETCALALLILSDRLPAGGARRFLRLAAASILEALGSQAGAIARALAERCRRCAAEDPVFGSDSERARAVRDLSPMRKVLEASHPPDRAVMDLPAHELALVALRCWLDQAAENDAARTLVERRLDTSNMAFFHPVREAGAVPRRYSNHPLVLLALSILELPFGDCLPRAVTPDAVGLTDAQVRAWASMPPTARDTCRGTEAEVGTVELVHAGSECPAIWGQGSVTLLGVPVLAILGHAHTLPPLSEPLFGTDARYALVLEELLFRVVEQRLAASPCAVARVLPWPAGGPPPLVVRHDVDRRPNDAAFLTLLDLYRERGLRASWYWIPGRLDPERMRSLHEFGHEIGLHTLGGLAKREEMSAIGDIVGAPSGECYHGAGAEYHRGALSFLASAVSGLEYSEVHPCMYGFPYLSFPLIGSDGRLAYDERLVHITFNVTTDCVPGQSRKSDYTGDAGFVLGTRRLAHYVCMLNHPDMNLEALRDFLDCAATDSLETATAADVATWWRRSHRSGNVRLRVRDERLIVDGSALPKDAAIELYGRIDTRTIVWQGAAEAPLPRLADPDAMVE